MNYLVAFNRNSGKIETTMECLGAAQLKLWALQHCEKSMDCIVFDEDGIVINYYEGTKDMFPKIYEGGEHVDTYCVGLYDAIVNG